MAVPGGPEAGSATGFGLLTVGVAGTLAGAGRLDNMVVVSGEVNPGDAADPALTGTLEIGSSISFNPNSHLVLDLAGPAPSEYDSLHANSSLSLADGQTITVRLQGYIPAAGQVFQLVGAPSLSAADINFILPALPPHLEWDTTEFPSSGAISVKLSDNLYRQWRAQYFSPAELQDASISGPAADPDHDSLPNALEFATGLPPRLAGSAPAGVLPSPVLIPGPDESLYP